MDKINIQMLRKVLNKNARLFQLKMIDKKRDLYFMKEDYHFFTVIENEVFRWELQIAIDVSSKGLIHSMVFLHPVVITDETKSSYIEFANAANLYLGSAMGRFWVNDENDFCYESYLPEFLMENEKELEQQLFDIPFAHFRDCLSPLMKMRNREWEDDKAKEYLHQLRDEGYVNNEEYGLWD